jgi:hypothetical protein
MRTVVPYGSTAALCDRVQVTTRRGPRGVGELHVETVVARLHSAYLESVKFVPSPTLNADAAQRIALPAVRQATRDVERLAKSYAPPGKTWVSARDARVRESHRIADGQEIPDNLRYKVPKVNYHNWMQSEPGFDLARKPRDPNLPVQQTRNCRCVSVEVPEAVAKSIHSTEPAMNGDRVAAEVFTQFPRAAESEFGTSDDTAAKFFGKALTDVERTSGFRLTGD